MISIVTIYFVVICVVLLLIFNYTRMNNTHTNEREKIVQNEQNNIENIENNKTQNKSTLALYYTNWCGYSRQFIPIWDEFISIAPQTINYEKYNCEENPSVCNKYNIKGYPTLYLHKGDINIQYNGNRTINDLLDFVKKNT